MPRVEGSAWDVTLAGPLAVRGPAAVADERAFGGGHARLAFAYLFLERSRPVPREELAEVLWEGRPPRTWDVALRGTVSKVRRALAAAGYEPAEVVTTAYGCLQVRLDGASDVEAARAAANEAEALLRRRDIGDAAARADFVLAATAEPFMRGVESSWAARVRTELRELRLRALDVAGACALQARRAADAAAFARDALELDQLRERSWISLIDAHGSAGDRDAALAAFDECREALVDGLGLSPSDDVEAALRRAVEPPALAAPSAVFPKPLRVVEPFVGRDAELARVAAAWDRGGAVSLCAITGEPGIGKTRLAVEAARRAADDGAAVLFGRCDQAGYVPYQPFLEGLRHLLTHLDPALVEETVREDRQILARLVPALGRTPAEVDESDSARYRLFTAVAGFLTRLATIRPTVLVIDDIHWADRPTLLLLRQVVRTCDAPLLVLATYRDTEPVDALVVDLLDDARRNCRADHIGLRGLDEEAVGALVERLGARRHVPPSLDADLASATSGNPLFVAELVRHLAERGVSADEGHDLVSSGLPEGVRDVLGHRLGALGHRAEDVLTAAAVLGQRFELDVVVAAVGDEGVVETVLARARHARLVVEDNERVDCLAFAHPLVRQHLLDQAGASKRMRLHRRLGVVLAGRAGRAGDDTGPLLVQIAHHFAAAAPSGTATQAVEYAIRAGRWATSVAAFEEAARLYALADAAAGLEPEVSWSQRCDLVLALGDAHYRAGDIAASRTAFDRAFALAEGGGDGGRMAAAALGFAGEYRGMGLIDERCIAMLERALDVLGPSGGVDRCLTMSRLAEELQHAGDAGERSSRLSEGAVAMARRIGEPRPLATTLISQLWTLHPGSAVGERRAITDEIARLARAAHDRDLEGLCRLTQLGNILRDGDLRGFDRHLAEHRSLVNELGRPIGFWLLRSVEVTRTVVSGRLAEAEAAAAEALQLGQRAGEGDVAMLLYAAHIAMVRYAQGRVTEMEAALRVASGTQILPAWSAALAAVMAEKGEHDEAAALVDELVPRSLALPRTTTSWAAGMAWLAEATAAVGSAGHAEALYDALLPFGGLWITAGPATACFGSTDHFLGLLAETIGKLDLADDHLAAAEASLEAAGALPWLTRTLHARSRVLDARGSPGDAAQARALSGRAGELAALLDAPKLVGG